MQLNQCGLRRPCNSALASLPKYTATVIDAFPEEDRAFKHVSTVFIVPQGMELDWLISTSEGQAQVVAGADAARVFLVTLNRGHAFSSAKQVQKELSPWIRTLIPTYGLPPTLNPTATPYTTTPQGIGHRTVLIEAWSHINGPIVVEDVRLVEPGRIQATTFRRMVFLDSPSLIQSEAVLIHTEPGGDRKEGDGAAQARCENGEELLGDLPGVSGPDAKRSHSGDLEWGRSGEEKVESNHQKKTRRNGDELGSVSSGALEEASDKPLGGGERDHRKRARRRRGGSSERLGSGGELRASEANALGEGLRFCGGAESVDRLTSEENGGRGEMVAGPEAESREDATCPEGADGVHTSGEAGDREERRVSCTANAGGEYSDSTWASLADIRNGAIDPLRGPEGNHRGIGVSPGVDFSYLASDYLQAMVAGLAFLGPVIEERTEARGLLDVLVIGLGGGGMPMFLRRHLPCRVEVIEIDPTVVELASKFFGVSQDAAFQVHIADAVPWVVAAASDEVSPSKSRKGSFDAVLIDVESASGQCPPPAFLEYRFLASLRALLRPNGVFAMNVVAPDERREATYREVRNCLSHRLYEWSGPENSNRVFFPHQRSGDESPDVSPTSPECTPEGEVLMPAAIGHMSPSHRLGEDPDKDTVDLVYWASRLAEKGAGMTSWARGPDLPSLVADIRMLRAAV